MNYKVSDTSLTSVANAIRSKTGESSQLEFPSDFVSAIGNIPSGGTTLITKSITANGTYDADDDSADGYSSVTVAVTSRFVRGTFTGASAEKGSQKNISLPYSGSGYPIAGVIYPTVGVNKSGSDLATLVQRYVIVEFAFAKVNMSESPDYDENVEKNQCAVMSIYKNSTSDSTTHTSSYSLQARTYNSAGATTPHSNAVRFKDATTLSVFIANESYGFKDGVEYTYEIVYSA